MLTDPQLKTLKKELLDEIEREFQKNQSDQKKIMDMLKDIHTLLIQIRRKVKWLCTRQFIG